MIRLFFTIFKAKVQNALELRLEFPSIQTSVYNISHNKIAFVGQCTKLSGVSHKGLRSWLSSESSGITTQGQIKGELLGFIL